MEFSFSASGWLFIYQLGVVKAFQKAGLHKLSNIRATGSSGGSLVSAVLLVEADVGLLKKYLLDCVADCKESPHINSFKMREYVAGAFDVLKEAGQTDFHSHPAILNKQLGISVTALPSLENHVISDFDSQEEFVEAILGSCTMTPLAGLPFRMNRPKDNKLHKSWVFDGGLSNIQPHVLTEMDEVVTISAFSHWDSNIRPSRYVPVWWGLHPPSVEEMDALFHLGEHDAQQWLLQNKDKFDSKELNFEFSDVEAKLEPLSRSNQRDMNERMDSIVKFTQRNLVAGIALGTIYAELGWLAGYNIIKALAVGAEEKRRGILQPSKHFLSIRRWLPSDFIGNSTENLSKSLKHTKKLFKLGQIWREIKDIRSGRIEAHENSVVSTSYLYRTFFSTN